MLPPAYFVQLGSRCLMPSEPARPKLDLAMPAHNEGASIEMTLLEWYAELSPRIDVRFIVAEDGSKDDTKCVLRKLEGQLPMLLDMVDTRRGYGGAMTAALSASTTPYVLTSDSDGQSDPSDFWRVWEMREMFDLVVGWRVNRADNFIRKVMSKSFRLYHRLLFGTRLHDPSCNVMLMKRSVIDAIVPKVGLLSEGFQWEFVARALKAGIKIGEVPLNHRLRTSGSTVVYKPARIPGIAWRNGIGLLKIWLDR
jgi:glycosyltransferase involved in cell wall biosynthesis